MWEIRCIFSLLRSDLGQNKSRVCCLHSKIAFAAYRYRFCLARVESCSSRCATNVEGEPNYHRSPTQNIHLQLTTLHTMFFFYFSTRLRRHCQADFCRLHSPPAILFLTKTLLFHVSLTGPGLTNHQNIISKFYQILSLYLHWINLIHGWKCSAVALEPKNCYIYDNRRSPGRKPQLPIGLVEIIYHPEWPPLPQMRPPRLYPNSFSHSNCLLSLFTHIEHLPFTIHRLSAFIRKEKKSVINVMHTQSATLACLHC